MYIYIFQVLQEPSLYLPKHIPMKLLPYGMYSHVNRSHHRLYSSATRSHPSLYLPKHIPMKLLPYGMYSHVNRSHYRLYSSATRSHLSCQFLNLESVN